MVNVSCVGSLRSGRINPPYSYVICNVAVTSSCRLMIPKSFVSDSIVKVG